jgi:hypothetical protein
MKLKIVATLGVLLGAVAVGAHADPVIPPDGPPPSVERFYSDATLTHEIGMRVTACDYTRHTTGEMSAYSTYVPLDCGW